MTGGPGFKDCNDTYELFQKPVYNKYICTWLQCVRIRPSPGSTLTKQQDQTESRQSSTKFLGVQIIEDLSWTAHMRNMWNCKVSDCKTLQPAEKTAEKIIGTLSPSYNMTMRHGAPARPASWRSPGTPAPVSSPSYHQLGGTGVSGPPLQGSVISSSFKLSGSLKACTPRPTQPSHYLCTTMTVITVHVTVTLCVWHSTALKGISYH